MTRRPIYPSGTRLLQIAILATLIGLIWLSFIGCASSNLGRCFSGGFHEQQ